MNIIQLYSDFTVPLVYACGGGEGVVCILICVLVYFLIYEWGNNLPVADS